MLNLQNIDDRYIFEWNNIRIIGKKEQDIHNYVLLKDSLNNNNVISVNFDSDGVSLIGSNYKTGKENQDKSVSHFEINMDNNKQSVYQKDLNLMSMDNLQNTLMNKLKPKRNEYYDNNHDSITPNTNEFDTFSFRSVDDKVKSNDDKNTDGIETSNTEQIQGNPCFNKGYFIEELKIYGKGNYTECFDYIDNLLPNDTFLNNTHIALNHKVMNSLKNNNHVIMF
jgi:hypothetical protein